MRSSQFDPCNCDWLVSKVGSLTLIYVPALRVRFPSNCRVIYNIGITNVYVYLFTINMYSHQAAVT